MRVGCLMVTENRAPIAGIGIATFLCQVPSPGLEAVLLVLDNDNVDPTGYGNAIKRLEPDRRPWQKVIYSTTSLPRGIASVPARSDIGCRTLFDDYACDLVALWDDDDHTDPTRLSAVLAKVRADDQGVFDLYGYRTGWFVNLRTFRGEFYTRRDGTLWGGSLTFNRRAWERHPFTGMPAPGYDEQFALAEDYLGYIDGDHYSFSHGKNVATWLMTAGQDMSPVIEAWPAPVRDEVQRSQRFLIDRRVFPPQPPG